MPYSPRRIVAIILCSTIAAPLFTVIGEAGVHFMDRSQGPLSEVPWSLFIRTAATYGLIAGVGFAFTERSFDRTAPRHFLRDWVATASAWLFMGVGVVRRSTVGDALKASLFTAVVLALLTVSIYRAVTWVIEPKKT